MNSKNEMTKIIINSLMRAITSRPTITDQAQSRIMLKLNTEMGVSDIKEVVMKSPNSRTAMAPMCRNPQT